MNKSTESARRVNAHSNPKNQPSEKIDWRKQLFNDRESGPVEAVQLPAEMITRLWGILLDIDTRLFRKDMLTSKVRENPRLFHKKVVRRWLSRHAALSDAEVLLSGQGLHVIIWFTEAIEFATDTERQRWAGIVKVIQSVLPSDPDMPGITALSRPRGSVNSKNGVKVVRLQAGRPVSKEVVLELFEQLRQRPFHTVMTILFGAERMQPCPVCEEEDSTLSALDMVGNCYGSCGKVSLAQLYDVFLRPRPPTKRKR